MIDSLVKYVLGKVSILGIDPDGVRRQVMVDYRGRIALAQEGLFPVIKDGYTRKRIAAGQTLWKDYAIPVNSEIELFDIHFTTRQAKGMCVVFSHDPDVNSLVEYGGFNSSGDVSQWTLTNVTPGDVGTLSYSTEQAHVGAGAAKIVYTKSDSGHANLLSRTFSTPLDFTTWRYLSAWFYNVPPGGGTFTRTISVVLTDGASNTRKYDVSGVSNVAPFNASGWIQILADVENPTSITGTAFDVANVVSMTLQWTDSATRSGTVYWDDVRLSDSLSLAHILCAGAPATLTHPCVNELDSVEDKNIYLMIQNQDTVAGEFTGVWFGNLAPEA